MRLQDVTSALAVFTLTLTACQQNRPPAAQAAPPPQNDALVARVAVLETKLKEVSEQAATTDMGLNILQNQYTSAEFDPTESAFQRINSNVATFAVSVQDVSQFGDGVKLKLNLGNLTAAAIMGVTLHIAYGPRRPKGDAYYDWYNDLKKKDAEILETLVPGSWNPTTVVLPGIEPRNFGYVSIAIDSKTISLRKR
jgi:hypothetical protein